MTKDRATNPKASRTAADKPNTAPALPENIRNIRGQRRGPSIITKTLSHRPATMHPKNFLTPDNARRLGAL